ncbi:hypothetical protein [Nibricoccus sp. IMCC34717]|uniref:hypothetical protein n=1 Tax=Nibricoccus sp. IMCC34717 TaxID=3034021 RepID=UPI00384FE5B9
MITPDPTPAAGPSGAALPVPVDMLAVEGVKPAVGDETDAQVTLRVQRLEGAIAFVVPVAINGQPLPSEEAGETLPDDEEMERMATEEDAKTV